MKKVVMSFILMLSILLLSACTKDKQEEFTTGEELSYQLDLSFDPEEHTISGTETVIIKNTSEKPWDMLSFRDYPSDQRFQKKVDGGITNISDVSYVYSSGKKTKGQYVRDEKDATILYFKLAKELQPEEFLKISFDFSVSIPRYGDRFGYSDISHNLGYFFPILSKYEEGEWVNHPTVALGECAYSECAVFDVTIDVPKGYTVITTGEQVPDQKINTFHAENVRDFTVVIGNNYDVVSSEWEGVEINSYYLRGNEEGGRKVLEAAIASMEAFTEAIGPYPYASIDYVETAMQKGAMGMEYPQLIMIMDGVQSLDKLYGQDLTGLITSHETAHQWFYGIIGNDQYAEAWIDEGFASYLENVYYEYIGVLTEEETFRKVPISVEVFHNNQGLGGEALNQGYSDFANSNLYSMTVYTRAAEFLISLRRIMGNEAFKAAVKEIYEKYRFEEIKTEQVLDIFKSHTTEDLSGIYNYYFDLEE